MIKMIVIALTKSNTFFIETIKRSSPEFYVSTIHLINIEKSSENLENLHSRNNEPIYGLYLKSYFNLVDLTADSKFLQ